VHRLSHSRLAFPHTCMSKVKAPNSTRQPGTVARRRVVGMSRQAAVRGGLSGRFALPAATS
jgi:hypothetical protein